MKLQDLGLKYGTDKAGIHRYNNKTFLDVYEYHLKGLKDSKINFLELGILNGSSLRVWEEYFPNGNIIGLDIDPAKKIYETNRIKVYTGSQASTELIKKIVQDYPDGLDVVLDDASHLNQLTIQSFNELFSYVKPGGYYIIEDRHCTYGDLPDQNFEAAARGWPGMHLNSADTKFTNNRGEFLEFILPKITALDFKMGEIFSMHFYSETLVIKKCS